MTELQSIATQLQAVEQEIEAIQPKANELQDRYQLTTRAEGKAMRESDEWQVVERWKDLLTQRAKLRDAYDVEHLIHQA